VNRGTLAAVGAILLTAAVARGVALDFCLPSALCRPDEEHNALIGLSIAKGDLNPHFFNYPTLYFYALALLDRGLFLVSDVEGSTSLAGGLAPLLLAGRRLAVVAGCLTVLATWFLGRRLGGPTTGLIAAALLAVNYLHVRDSHFLAPDVPAGLMVTLALIWMLRAMQRGDTRSFLIAGVAVGLAASIKYNAGAVAAGLVAACGLAPHADADVPRLPGGRRPWLALAAAAAAFFLTSPFVLLDGRTFVQQFGWELRHFREGFYPGPRDVGTVGYYTTRILPYGLGLLPLSLAVVGAGKWLAGWHRRGLVVLAFLAASLLLVAGGTTVFARYLVPAMPALCCAAAVGLEQVAGVIPRFRRPATIALLALALAQPSWSTIAFDRLLSRDDTREQAAAWIRANLPPRAILQVGGTGGHHWVLDPATVPGFHLLNQADATQPWILEHPLRELSRRGVRYVLTHDHPLLYSTLLPGVADRLREGAIELACFDPFVPDRVGRSVYDYEDAFYLPFAGFGGVLRPGPHICIYELPADAR
jgi:Dolichyl-phosphate-mannose-protein mannosyltransferase